MIISNKSFWLIAIGFLTLLLGVLPITKPGADVLFFPLLRPVIAFIQGVRVEVV